MERMERRGPNMASIALDDFSLTLKGSTCTVMRGDEMLSEKDAPFHCVTTASGSLPVYDIHFDESAADCLADFLPHCGFVVLTVKDSASTHWSPKLTEVLQGMGAKHVPPAPRASWCFLWQRTAGTPVCLETYKLPNHGKAEIEAFVADGETTDEFHVISAGWQDGYMAAIKINGKEALHRDCRGVNIYVRHCSRPNIRHFVHVDPCSNFIHHCSEGRHVVVATGNAKTTSYKRLPLLFYKNLMRLGGTGGVLNPSEAFILAGCKSMDYPPVEQEIPDIADEMNTPPADTQRGLAYASLLFGDKVSFLTGALVLAESLKRSSPEQERILLVSSDVPETFRGMLRAAGWTLKDAEFLYGSFSLFHPDNTSFPPEIFMKLHIFNPDLFPYEKVLFLDLDILVRSDLSHLFAMETPAAVSNWRVYSAEHPIGIDWETQYMTGDLMNSEETTFNAGVMLVTPNRKLFNVLVKDISTPGKHHKCAWTPEQTYLGRILAGYMRHLPVAANFEVNLHGGVRCSRTWAETTIDEAKVVHFSGDKPWNCNPHEEVICCRGKYESTRRVFQSLPENLRYLATARAVQFSREWHGMFEDVLRDVSARCGIEESPIPVYGLTPVARMENYLKATTTSA